MKNLLGILFIAISISACEKDSDEPTQEQQPTVLYGEWRIYPVGQPTDSFFYRIQSTVPIDSLNFMWVGGHVSDGPIVVPTVSGFMYAVFYRDTFPDNWHTHKNINVTTSQVNFTDSIPATVY